MALSGKIDRRVTSWLTGAPLTALYKKQGQEGIRPIAVGETLRRLISRVCCAAVQSKLPTIFLSYKQVGVGVSGGLEAVIHTLNYFINSNDNNPSLCCLNIDMANAFNNCDRHSFLNRLQRELPELYSWVL